MTAGEQNPRLHDMSSHFSGYKEWRKCITAKYRLDLPPYGKPDKNVSLPNEAASRLLRLSHKSARLTMFPSSPPSPSTSTDCDSPVTDVLDDDHVPVSDEDVTVPQQKPVASVSDNLSSSTSVPSVCQATVTNSYCKGSSLAQRAPNGCEKRPSSNVVNTPHSNSHDAIPPSKMLKKLTKQEYDKLDANGKGHYVRNQLDEIGQSYLDKLHNACVVLSGENQKLKKEKAEIMQTIKGLLQLLSKS